MIARHGTIVLFGNTSGTPASIDISAFFGHEGAELRTYFSYDPPGKPDTVTDLAFLAAVAADGRLKLEVGFEADWSRLGEAIAGLKAREFQGKAVMTLGN